MLSLKPKILLICYFILVLAFAINAQTALQGKVTTLNGFAIANASLIIESDEYLYKTETDKDGFYKTELPVGARPGFYKIYIQTYMGKFPYKEKYILDGCQSYFRPATRANVRLDFNDPVTINFILIESEAVCSWADNPQKIPYGVFAQSTDLRAHPLIRFESLTKVEDLEIPLDIMIQYGSRSEKNGKIIYSTYILQAPTSVFGGQHPGVVITYNRMTIYANRVEFDKKRQVISADENIVVEDGKERYRVKALKITIKNGVPKFDFTK